MLKEMKQKVEHKERWDTEINTISSEHENREHIINQRTMHEFSSQQVQIKWWQVKHRNIGMETAHKHNSEQDS